jgi:hypothetical protein
MKNDGTCSLYHLRRATDTLCSSRATLDELQSAAGGIHDLFAGITQLTSEPDSAGSSPRTILPEGHALSPKDAAGCVLDFRRTNVFLRGLESAIAEASARFPGETIHVLYAGCGPFAPFCLLPLLQFPAMDVQFTLIDIHQSSLDAARQLAETLGVQQGIRDYIRCDAASYQQDPGTDCHLVLTETLQAALRGEGQVAITANLAPQVQPGGFFLPQQISIGACLLNPATGVTKGCIHLGQILELSAQTAHNLPAVEVAIPKLATDDYTLALLTHITVFGPHKLGPGDSGLTSPVLLREVHASDTPAIVRFTYERGVQPGFNWRMKPAS